MIFLSFLNIFFIIFRPEYVAKGILKLLEDRINGSTLGVTKKGYFYIGYQEELKEYIGDIVNFIPEQ